MPALNTLLPRTARAWLHWPDSLFARLACLLTVVAVASHVLAVTLMFEFRPAPPPHPQPPAHPRTQGDPQLQPITIGQDKTGYTVRRIAPTMFEGEAPASPPPQPRMLWGFLLDMGIRLLALLIAAWFAARWLAQPIRKLAMAAQELGRNIHRPPLPVSGPQECREASHVFNHMQEQICQQLLNRDRLVAAVSHDLRTPLTRLRLRAEMLDDAQASQEIQHDIAEMESMIRDTLDYLRGQAQGPQMVRVHLQALLQSVVDDHALSGAVIPLTGQTDPIEAQPGPLRRCIDNLVGNALRYGGGAEIHVTQTDTTVSITIRDHGPGLPEASLQEVMQPFVRMEGSRHRDHGGVGLGLSIARDIARRHHGELLLHNAPDGGLRAVLALPRFSTKTPASA